MPNKVTLTNISSGYASTTQVNANFQAIQDELNLKVLYRDNPVGTTNTMQNDLDMNSHNITNLGSINGVAATVITNLDAALSTATTAATNANASAASANTSATTATTEASLASASAIAAAASAASISLPIPVASGGTGATTAASARTNLGVPAGSGTSTNTNTGDETTTTLGATINAATAKTTPVGADLFAIVDSAASNIIKKLSFTNFLAWLVNTANTWTISQRGTLTTNNTLSYDLNVTNNVKSTPSAGGALTFTNIASATGQSGFLLFTNGSNYAITAGTGTKVGSSLLATISTTGVYLLSYFSDGTSVYVVASGALS